MDAFFIISLYILLRGRPALHIAAVNNNVEAAKLFLLNGADVNANDWAVNISDL
jgi:ankyrin repeat protein